MGQPKIELKQRACPACAAPIPPIPRDSDTVRCPYCEQTFEVVGRPRERRRRERAPPPSPTPTESPTPRRSQKSTKEGPTLGQRLVSCGFIAFAVLAAFLLLLSILVPATVGAIASVNPELGQSLGAWLAVPVEGPPELARPTAGYSFRSGAYPALADVDGDGISDLIAPYSVSDEGGESQHYIGAFSGFDLTPIWALGPFSGAEREPLGAIIIKDRLVVQEPFGVVSIVELRTGRRSGQLQLDRNPGRANLCRWTPEGTEVLVNGDFLVDALSGVSRPKKVAMYDLPPTCGATRGSQNTTQPGLHSSPTAAETMRHSRRGSRTRRGPDIPGHKILMALVDGEHGIAVIESERGREERLLVGFNPSDLSERWRAPAGALLTGLEEGESPSINIDLGRGAVVWGYNPSGKTPDLLMGRIPPRLLILDAETGAKRHDLEIGSNLGVAFRFSFADDRVWFAEDTPGASRAFAVDLHTAETLVFGGSD